MQLWVGHCCLSLAGGVLGVLGGVQLGVGHRLLCCVGGAVRGRGKLGGAGRGAVRGRSPAAFLWLLCWGRGVLGRVQLGVGHSLPSFFGLLCFWGRGCWEGCSYGLAESGCSVGHAGLGVGESGFSRAWV